ncbi:hypothetical protein ACHAXM_003002 [Skeletonema potamos]
MCIVDYRVKNNWCNFIGMSVEAAKTPSAKLKLPFGVDVSDVTVSAILPPLGMRLVTAAATDFDAACPPNRLRVVVVCK